MERVYKHYYFIIRGSEHGGYSLFETHCLIGEPFWLGRTERSIFSKIAFVEYGYFYDLDHKWYYIIPGPFKIKMPLELIGQHLDESGYEFDFSKEVMDRVLKYIFDSYVEEDAAFVKYMEKNGYALKTVIKEINVDGMLSVVELYDRYKKIYDYFDDWILIKANVDNTEIEDIIVKKRKKKHIETCKW